MAAGKRPALSPGLLKTGPSSSGYQPRREYRRVELRSPDPTANPYIAFALLIYAVLDGFSPQASPAAQHGFESLRGASGGSWRVFAVCQRPSRRRGRQRHPAPLCGNTCPPLCWRLTAGVNTARSQWKGGGGPWYFKSVHTACCWCPREENLTRQFPGCCLPPILGRSGL